MERTQVLAVVLALLVNAAAGASWGYSGDKGPSFWGTTLGYNLCTLSSQSPIDLDGSVAEQDTSLGTFTLTDYTSAPTTLSVQNNGHTVQVDVTGSQKISGGGLESGTYALAQFHFHWGADDTKGSEHTVNGAMYPMELHLVHWKESLGAIGTAANTTKGLAVLGFFFEIQDANNTAFDSIITALSSIVNAGSSTTITPFALTTLIPSTSDLVKYYRYQGSLTTPACYESVQWTVFDKTIKISSAQMSVFRTVKFSDGSFQTDNFRPVQPRNSRSIKTSNTFTAPTASAGITQPLHVLLLAVISATVVLSQKTSQS